MNWEEEKEQNCHATVLINHQIEMYAITLRLSFILFGYLVLKWIERVDRYVRGGSTMPTGSEHHHHHHS